MRAPGAVFHETVTGQRQERQVSMVLYEDGAAMVTFARDGISTYVHFGVEEVEGILAMFVRAANELKERASCHS